MSISSEEELQNRMAVISGSHGGDPAASKKRRNQPGNPDPSAEVVSLSPRALLATNRYICEVCHKGFQRDQNLQLHRRGHNLPWKLKQRSSVEVKKRVFVCPEISCTHHDPGRALGDLTGIKKHYSRKHGEKKWKCDKCSKRYAVQSDWKAHSKICGTKEYRCDCGTIFSRKDSFVTHRAFCEALNEENYSNHYHHHHAAAMSGNLHINSHHYDALSHPINPSSIISNQQPNSDALFSTIRPSATTTGLITSMNSFTSATALLQKAAQMGVKVPPPDMSSFAGVQSSSVFPPFQATGADSRGRRDAGEGDGGRADGMMTQDFLGLGDDSVSMYNEDDMYSYHHISGGHTPLGKHMWEY